MDESQVRVKVLTLFTQPHLVVVLSTVDEEGSPQSRLMGAMVPVPERDFSWYLETSRDSRKVKQLHRNPRCQILAFNHDYTEVATLSGTARLVDDDAVRKLVWDAVPGSAEYFSDWKDPQFAVMQFDVEGVEYLNLTLRLEPFHFQV